MEKLIYLDHAATTKTCKEAADAMLPFLAEQYGNAGSLYSLGVQSKKALTEARKTIAESLGASAPEIYFTSGGSESDNWALIGAAEAFSGKGKHIITSQIEHHAVLETCHYLEKRGYEITCVPVDENGILKVEELERAIRKDTILISVMYANNEIGTLQPIREIGSIAKKYGVCFHTDAVQAYGHVPVSVKEENIVMLSGSAHKLGGPKGIGFLYIRQDTGIASFIHGGQQERGRRAGTENVPGAAGFSAAVKIAFESMEVRREKEKELRDYLIERVEKEIPYCRLNGDRSRRLPGNANFSFPFVEGESLLIRLDMKGICASSGSACTSGSDAPSHVLLALGLSEEEAKGSLRLSLGFENTKEEIDIAVNHIKEIVEDLRALSPFYADFVKKNKGNRV